MTSIKQELNATERNIYSTKVALDVLSETKSEACYQILKSTEGLESEVKDVSHEGWQKDNIWENRGKTIQEPLLGSSIQVLEVLQTAQR